MDERTETSWYRELPLSDGSFDDLFFGATDDVHVERLSRNQVWVGLTRGDRHYHIYISAKGPIAVVHRESSDELHELGAREE